MIHRFRFPVVQAIPLCEGIQLGFAETTPLLSSQPWNIENEFSCSCRLKNPGLLPPVIHDKTCPMRNRPRHFSCHAQESPDGKNDED